MIFDLSTSPKISRVGLDIASGCGPGCGVISGDSVALGVGNAGTEGEGKDIKNLEDSGPTT